MDVTLVIFFAAVLIIGGALFAIIGLTKQSGRALNQNDYRSRWLAIEQALKPGEVSSYHLAVLNADKLLDKALRERGVRGETMGERMKTAQSTWSNRDEVWTAHKLRNQVAHEPNVDVSYEAARRALIGFKRALKDIGAI